MSLEKRSDGEAEALPAAGDKPGKKPVVVYIMILFIVAFLLMALSFLMHQRTNTEVLGELQHSVTTMQEVQAAQEKVIRLQEELAAAQEAADALAQQAEADAQALQELQSRMDALEGRAKALEALYCLQQSYSARDYDTCREIIREMEAQGYPALLPGDVSADGSITPPTERYTQLKDAVEGK